MNAELNVDPNEIRKFESIAHRWWDPESEFKPLHAINPLRLNYVDDRASLKNKRVLDVGCGGGILAESMARRGAKVKGIDLGEGPLSVASLHALDSQVEVDYQQIAVEVLAEQEAGQYDVVTCMEMLEHVPAPESVIQACARLVKPGGHVFFSTINRNPKAFMLAVVGAEYLLNMLPKGTHEYAKFIRPSELEFAARQAQLSLQDIKGMTYNPMFQSYRLGKDIDVNYLMHFKKEE
ncbi:bifunctional 2-polyprenyl-6-hydroxyphenol methylase/3-demethylubiquinol 3-O-methyltransferase UbiG [uncultured Thiothrix sp.]|uniref:bifunctional 2-polyprenyl-6-hydroxyphenol methylase/3-demethylubiquinol 3-O-methyltransferase UbiG n=1 Tax=uncultured Thiothrix sp. TaxID=223185 RepID=UPI002624E247|nr:bifunctional 2-polyprenyl-6-hydroxyphenol methylase/3-demethylubiquinol 3-O-methyltransferase UbiG [uncultured Thiothrix sp.]